MLSSVVSFRTNFYNFKAVLSSNCELSVTFILIGSLIGRVGGGIVNFRRSKSLLYSKIVEDKKILISILRFQISGLHN